MRTSIGSIFGLALLSFSAINAYAQTKHPSLSPSPSPSSGAILRAEAADSTLLDLPLAPQDTAINGVELATSYWQGFAKLYLETGSDNVVRVDYAKLGAEEEAMQALNAYIQSLSAQLPSKMPRNEAMAYWANLYNALTVQVVAQNYPVKSIRDIKSGRRKGPWRRELIVVEGKPLSLDNIEHGILRPTFNTPLVHYMLNCASIGCPNLSPQGWNAETLDADLDMAARAYINSARGVSFEGNRVTVSRIYKWFRKDFGGSKAGVLAHLEKYAEPDLREKLEARSKIDRYAYDWSLNMVAQSER